MKMIPGRSSEGFPKLYGFDIYIYITYKGFKGLCLVCRSRAPRMED